MPSRTSTNPAIYLCNRRSLPYGKLPEKVRESYDFFFVQENLLRDIKAPKESPLIAAVVGDWGQGKSTLKDAIAHELQESPTGSSLRVYTMNEVLSTGGGLTVRTGDVVVIDEVEDVVDKLRGRMKDQDPDIQKFFNSLKDIANMVGVDATVILMMSVSARHRILDPGGLLDEIAPGTNQGIRRRIKIYNLERPSKLEYLSIIHCHLAAMSLQQLTRWISLVDVLYYGLPALRSIGSGIVWDLLCELPQEEQQATSTILYKIHDRDVLQRIVGKEIPRLIIGDVNALGARERSFLLSRISLEDPGEGAVRGHLIPYREYEVLRQEYLSNGFDDEEKRDNALREILRDEDYVMFYVPQEGSAEFLDRVWVFVPNVSEEVYPMMRSGIWEWLEERVDGGKDAWVASWSWLGRYLNLETRDLIIKIDRNKLTEREVDDFVKKNLANDQLVMESFGRFMEIYLNKMIGNELTVLNMIDNSKIAVSCNRARLIPSDKDGGLILETEWQGYLGGNRQLSVPVDILITKRGLPPPDLKIDDLKPIILFSMDGQHGGGDEQQIAKHVELSAPEKRLLLQLHFLGEGGAEEDVDALRASLALLINTLRDEISDALSPYITLAWMDSIVDVERQRRIGNWLFYYLREGPVGLGDLYSAIKEDLLGPIYPYFTRKVPTEDLESPDELKRKMEDLRNNGLLGTRGSGSDLYIAEESYSEFLLTISKTLIFILNLYYQQDRNKMMKELIDFMFNVEESNAAKSTSIVRCISEPGLMSTSKVLSLLYFAVMNGALVRAAFDTDSAAFYDKFLERAGGRLDLLNRELTDFDDKLRRNKCARYYLTAKERDVKIIDARYIADYLRKLMDDIMNKKLSLQRDPKTYASILRKSIVIQNILKVVSEEYIGERGVRCEPRLGGPTKILDDLYTKLRENIVPWNVDNLSKFVSFLGVDNNKLGNIKLDNIVRGDLQIKNDIKRLNDILKRADLGCSDAPCIAEELKILVDSGSQSEHAERFREYIGELVDYLKLKDKHVITLSEFLDSISAKSNTGKDETVDSPRYYLEHDVCSKHPDDYKELCEFLRLSDRYNKSRGKIDQISNKIDDFARYSRPTIDIIPADRAIDDAIASLKKHVEELGEISDVLGPEFFEKCDEGTSSSSSAPNDVTATGGSTIGPSTNPAPNVEDELDIILNIMEEYRKESRSISDDYKEIRSMYGNIKLRIDKFAESIKELDGKRRGDLLKLNNEKIIEITRVLCNDEKYGIQLGNMCTMLVNINKNINKTNDYIRDAMKSLAALIRSASCQMLRNTSLRNADPLTKKAVGKNVLGILESKSYYDIGYLGRDYLEQAKNMISEIGSDLKGLNGELEKLLNEVDKNVTKYKYTLKKLGVSKTGCRHTMDIDVIRECLDTEISYRNEIRKRLQDIADECSLDDEGRNALNDLVERGSVKISELVTRGVDLYNIVCALGYLDAVIRIE
jgi:hypothetical protein